MGMPCKFYKCAKRATRYAAPHVPFALDPKAAEVRAHPYCENHFRAIMH